MSGVYIDNEPLRVNVLAAERDDLRAERERLREALTTIKKLTYDQPKGLFAEEAQVLYDIAADALGDKHG